MCYRLRRLKWMISQPERQSCLTDDSGEKIRLGPKRIELARNHGSKVVSVHRPQARESRVLRAAPPRRDSSSERMPEVANACGFSPPMYCSDRAKFETALLRADGDRVDRGDSVVSTRAALRRSLAAWCERAPKRRSRPPPGFAEKERGLLLVYRRSVLS